MLKNLRNNILRIIFASIVILQSSNLVAQNYTKDSFSDYQLAMQYYRSGEFEKAKEIYKKLYKSNHSHNYYYYYFDCLVKLNDYQQAEEVAKEQIKFDKHNVSYRVDLGYLYERQNMLKKAESAYETAIKKLPANQHKIIQLAYSFISKRKFDYAEQTYNKGTKILKGSYLFETEKAQLYYYQHNYEKMIEQYLSLLKKSRQYLQMVQNYLQNAIYSDIDNSLTDILQKALLKAINENPDKVVFNELLIWLYIQDNDFESAFIQAKAIDLRLNENGKRIMVLAKMATNNANFDVAVKAYQYVISKGNMLEYFYVARKEMLNIMYKRIELGLDTKLSDIKLLEKSYTDALAEEGINAETVDMVKNLAHLKAFYLGKTTEAWFLVEDAVNMRGINRMTKGELELELADIYLASGKIWDATFAYARIEEYNKNNKIGAEAKYRKARLAYYTGNFEWARAQLNVLKASTSKLPANDAANLGLFIYDNTGWGDSTEQALKMYARADLHKFQSKDSVAILVLDSLIQLHPNDELIDDSWLLKASLLAKQNNYNEAIKCYTKIIDNHYEDIWADKALFSIANILENHTQQPDEAKKYYKKLLIDFKGSVYSVEARKRFRSLRGDDVN